MKMASKIIVIALALILGYAEAAVMVKRQLPDLGLPTAIPNFTPPSFLNGLTNGGGSDTGSATSSPSGGIMEQFSSQFGNIPFAGGAGNGSSPLSSFSSFIPGGSGGSDTGSQGEGSGSGQGSFVNQLSNAFGNSPLSNFQPGSLSSLTGGNAGTDKPSS